MMGRLRTRIIVSTAIVAVTLAGFPHPIAAQGGTSGCLAPDDTSVRIVAYVKFILTDTSRASARTRDNLGITGVQPSQLVPVTNSRACSKIVGFFNDFEGVIRSRRDGAYKLIQSHMVF